MQVPTLVSAFAGRVVVGEVHAKAKHRVFWVPYSRFGLVQDR